MKFAAYDDISIYGIGDTAEDAIADESRIAQPTIFLVKRSSTTAK